MTLNIPLIGECIEIDENQVLSLVVENPSDYFRLTKQLVDDFCLNGDSIAVYCGIEEVPKSKIDVIYNYHDLSVNSKKNITKLYQKLGALAQNGDFYVKTQELNERVQTYISDLEFELSASLNHNVFFDVGGLLKMLNVTFYEDNASLVEKLINYMQISQEFSLTRVVFLVGVKNYLSDEELAGLYKQMFYRKLTPVVVENVYRSSLPNEKSLILDKDLCLIYK